MRGLLYIIPLLLIASSSCFSQTGPEQDGHEIQLWAGGGHSVSGGRGDTGALNAGLRYGWGITNTRSTWSHFFLSFNRQTPHMARASIRWA